MLKIIVKMNQKKGEIIKYTIKKQALKKKVGDESPFFIVIFSSICPALGIEEVCNTKTPTGTDRKKKKDNKAE